jgi:hypothetical protein
MSSLVEYPLQTFRKSTLNVANSSRRTRRNCHERASPVTTTPTPAYYAAATLHAPSSSLSVPLVPTVANPYDASTASVKQDHSSQIASADFNGGPAKLPFSSSQSPANISLPPLSLSNRPSSGAWNPTDDQTLMAARAQGMNWVPIQQAYFPSKTPNACRKRHERLMNGRSADDWDGLKLGNLAKTYMAMRKEIWSGLAAQTAEKWNVVEQKVYTPLHPYQKV